VRKKSGWEKKIQFCPLPPRVFPIFRSSPPVFPPPTKEIYTRYFQKKKKQTNILPPSDSENPPGNRNSFQKQKIPPKNPVGAAPVLFPIHQPKFCPFRGKKKISLGPPACGAQTHRRARGGVPSPGFSPVRVVGFGFPRPPPFFPPVPPRITEEKRKKKTPRKNPKNPEPLPGFRPTFWGVFSRIGGAPPRKRFFEKKKKKKKFPRLEKFPRKGGNPPGVFEKKFFFFARGKKILKGKNSKWWGIFPRPRPPS